MKRLLSSGFWLSARLAQHGCILFGQVVTTLLGSPMELTMPTTLLADLANLTTVLGPFVDGFWLWVAYKLAERAQKKPPADRPGAAGPHEES